MVITVSGLLSDFSWLPCFVVCAEECQKSALASSESERAVRQQLRVLEYKLTELSENGSRLQSEKESLKEQLDAMHAKFQLAYQAEKE